MTTPTYPPSNPSAPASAAPSDSVPATTTSAADAATPDAGSSGAKPDAKAEREARLAAALRENLKRRKAQARARRAPTDASGDNGNA